MPKFVLKPYINKKAFWSMLTLNIVMALGFVILATMSIRGAKQELIDESVESQYQRISGMVDVLGNTILTSQQTVTEYGNYIVEAGLSPNEAMAYLYHWKDNYAQIDLVNVETMTGWYMSPHSRVYKWRSYYTAEWFDDVVENEVRNELVCPIEIPQGVDESNKVALFTCFKINGAEYVLVCQLGVEEILVNGMTLTGDDLKRCKLIDNEGVVVYGRLPLVSTATGIDFWDFMAKDAGIEYVGAVQDELANNGTAFYEVRGHDIRDYIGMIITIPNTDNWAIAYSIDKNSIGFNTGTVHALIFAVVFLLLWLVLDVVGYAQFNKQLKYYVEKTESQNLELKRANQAKTLFVSNMSHEIRTPINAVLGLDEMIIRESTEESIKAYAYDIQKAGKTLLGIINDVLDFSKIESGKLEIVPAKYNMADVVSDIYTMINLKAQAKYLNFEVFMDNSMPSILYGDDIRIKQIIINLLTNAVKYTNEGKVSLDIESKNGNNGKVLIKVTVSDTGMGIKEDEIANLLVPYQRLDEDKNRTIEGTGLGLPIVDKLLQMMNSKLEVQSVYGEGSKFFFSIEQDIVNPKPIGVIDFAKINSAQQLNDIALYAPKARILVVDDTPLNIKVVKGLLKSTGIAIDESTSGARALKMTEEIDYDVILLDHRMPQMDGIEVLHALKDRGTRNANTPVIALTANVVSGAREMYLAEGFVDFISKPINGEQLSNVISGYLKPELQDSGEAKIAEVAKPETIEKEPVVMFVDRSILEFDDALKAEINVDEGLKNLGGDVELYVEVLKEFNKQFLDCKDKIIEYQQQRNLLDYTTLVHSIKSSARTIGATRLFKAANILEICGNSGDWDSIDERTDKLLTDYQKVGEMLEAYMLGK